MPTDKGSDIKKGTYSCPLYDCIRKIVNSTTETKKLPDPKPLGFKDFIQKHLEVPKEHLTIRSQSPSVSLEVVANINSKLQADSDARAKVRIFEEAKSLWSSRTDFSAVSAVPLDFC